ncbi:NAD-dependent epimerase/dehydratase family protein [Chloroflexota bacterium]
MRILITGGAGFMGTTLAGNLVRDNNEITLLDMDFEHSAWAFSELRHNKNINLVKADIMDLQEVERATRDAEVVLHLAAMVGVQEVIHNALYTLDVNYIGTSNLLKAVSQGSHCKRLIYFSTSEIYGDNPLGMSEDADSILSSMQNVRWCYCISKLAAEHLALSYSRQKNLPVVIVRPFNTFGPGRVGDHVILRFILKALSGEDLEVYGNGTQIRSWCYIDDFCSGVLQCMKKERVIGQTFNLGNPRNTLTIYDLAKRVILLCGSKSRISYKRLDFKDIDIRVPDITKARGNLGFDPKVEMEEGLLATIEWVKANVDELSSLMLAKKKQYVL